MVKLFAIFTVLAALPVSALAGEVSTNPTAIKCQHDQAKAGLAIAVSGGEQAPVASAVEGR